MRAPTNLARSSLGFNMTPMIDVVFLLIIFFLVSSHMVRQETQLEMEELNLPKAGSGQPPEEDEIRRLVVNILPEWHPYGRIIVGGQRMQGKQLAQLIGQASRSGRQVEVRIRADRKAPYRVVEPVMIACAKAGVWKVTFAVVGKR